MSPERLARLKQNAPNYDDYDARVDVAELVAEVERLRSEVEHWRMLANDEEAENVFYAKYTERFMIPDPPTST